MPDRFDAPHAEHDPVLIAALAAGDLQPVERSRAEDLVAACPECAVLTEDLRAIALATAALPARPRPRDFSIRPEDAARLGRRGWRGLVAALAGPRAAGLRPLATGLTTLGIAGLLLAAMPSIQLGGAASAPTAPTLAPAAGAASREVDTAAEPAASRSARDGTHYGSNSEPPGGLVPVTGQVASPIPLEREVADENPPAPDRLSAEEADAALSDTRPASPLVVLSGAFLALGLVLFGIRWAARRLAADRA